MIQTIERSEPNGLGVITNTDEHVEREVAQIFITEPPIGGVLCEIGFVDEAGEKTVLRLRSDYYSDRLVITAQGRGEAVIILP